MIINIAHASTETILQTVAASQDPVLYSHGGYRHVVNIPRNISDEAAKAVAAKGGVVGRQIGNSMNNPRDFARRQDEARRKGTAPRTAHHARSAAPVEPSADDVRRTEPADGQRPAWRAAPGPAGRADDRRRTGGGDRLRRPAGRRRPRGDRCRLRRRRPPPHGIEDISDYPKITEGLVRKGYSDQRIRKIMGLNLLRLIRQVTEKSPG